MRTIYERSHGLVAVRNLKSIGASGCMWSSHSNPTPCKKEGSRRKRAVTKKRDSDAHTPHSSAFSWPITLLIKKSSPQNRAKDTFQASFKEEVVSQDQVRFCICLHFINNRKGERQEQTCSMSCIFHIFCGKLTNE